MCDPHQRWADVGYPDEPPFRCRECGEWDEDCRCPGGPTRLSVDEERAEYTERWGTNLKRRE